MSIFENAGFSQNEKPQKGNIFRAYSASVKPKNDGAGSGLKYAGASLLAGIGRPIEGIADILSSVAHIGDNEYNKYKFGENKVGSWMQGIERDVNPNGLTKFGGTVAEGIGNSSTFLLDLLLPGLGTGLFFTGITGAGIGDAVQQTGELGFKEVGYGAASGALEAVTEKVLGAGGQVVGDLASAATQGAAKRAITKAAAKSGARSILLNVAKAAGGEFAEEFTEEFADVGLKRLFKIDNEARVTGQTFLDALYAGAAGAVSGGLMAAPAAVANYKGSAARGRMITEQGRAESLIKLAEKTSEIAGLSGEAFGLNKQAVNEKRKADTERTRGDKLKDAFFDARNNKENRATVQFGKAISDDLAVWNSLTEEQKAGEAGQALLGQIEGNLTFHWINAAIDTNADALAMLDDADLEEAAAEIKQLTGREYTVQEIREDKDMVLRQVAAFELINEMKEQIDELKKPDAVSVPGATGVEAFASSDAQGAAVVDQTEGQTAQDAQGSPVSGFDTAQANTSANAEQGKAAGLAVNPQGKRVSTDTGRQVRVKRVVSNDGKLTIETQGNELYKSETLTSDKIRWESQVMADAVRRAEEHKMPPLEVEYMIRAVERGTQLTGTEFADAYHYEYLRGKYGEGQSESTKLAQVDKDNAYDMGRTYGIAGAEERSKSIAAKANPEQAQKVRQTVAALPQAERVKLPDGMKFTDIRGEGRKAVVKAADVLSKAMGVKFEFYQSFRQTNGGERMMVAANGKVVTAPNGWYDTGTGVIHVDLNAGTGADGAGIFTMAHETGHWLMQSDPEAFRALGEFLFEKMGEDADALIREKQAFMEANGRLDGMSDEKKYAMAYEDVVCDLLSPALKDGNVIEQLAFENKSLFTRVWEHIKNIIRNIRDALKGAVGTNQLQKDAAEKLEASMKEVEDMVAAALQGAAQNNGSKLYEKKVRAVNEVSENYKFSDRDSEGNTLTTEQKEFFKDSKVRDEDGNLLVVYHGTDAEFTVFDIGKSGKNGRAEGYGFYFSDDKEITKRYGEKQKKLYLRIEKPAYNNRKTLKKGEIKRFVNSFIDYRMIQYDEDWKDSFISNYVDTYRGATRTACVQEFVDQIWGYNDNDQDLIYEIANGSGATYDVDTMIPFYKILTDSTGVDGIIATWEHKDGDSKVYVTFRSNQSKNVDNIKQTDNEDIRYSDREYMDAVESGDMETAQRMVEEAAVDAGAILDDTDENPLTLYHGTDAEFTRFDLSKAGERSESGDDVFYGVAKLGVFATPNEDYARIYQTDENRNPMKLFGFARNIYYMSYDDFYNMYNGYDGAEGYDEYQGEDGLLKFKNEIQEEGYDCICATIDGEKEYIFFNSEQLKSAETVTKNDSGKVIPLSERFNSGEKDIRYSDRKSLTTRELLADVTEEEVTLKRHKEFIGRYRELVRDLQDVDTELYKLDLKKRSKAGLTGDEQARVRALNEMRLGLDDKLTKMEGLNQAREIIEAVRTNTQRAVSGAQARVERAQREVDEYKEQVRERFERYREKRDAREQRNMDAMRERLEKERNRNEEWRDTYEKGEVKRKTLNIINKLNRELMHPTRDKNIPAVLQPDVVNALEAINTDVTQAEARMTALDEKIAAEMAKDAPDMEQIRIWERERANIEAIGQTYDKQMSAIQLVYERIKSSQNSEMRNAYDPELEAAVNDIANRIRGRSLNQLTLDELKEVRRVVGIVEHLIATYNETMATEKKQRVSDLGEKTTAEIKQVGGEHKTILSALHEILKFGWSQLKPAYAVKVIGSDTLQELYNNLVKGEDVWAVDKNEAKQFAESVKEKYKFNTWDLDKVVSVDTQRGKVDLTINQIMSLYAYSKRQQAVDHLTTGGFVLDNAGKVKEKWRGIPVMKDVNIQTPYMITLDDFLAIQRNLTDDQRAFVEDMMKYLSTTLAAKGNEVSRKLYGIDLFNEETYFPIRSARQFLVEENRAKGDPQIKNKGMTKQVTPGAGNPIVLSDFTSVWASHVEEMALYHGLVLPMEDMNRVLNWSSPTGEGVKVALDNAYGAEAKDYMMTLMKQLNGGLQRDKSVGLSNRMLSGFKRGATMASLSVVIQQPTSIIRSMTIIDPKYFKSGFIKSIRERQAVWDELKSWAPVALIKESGSFDVDIGASDEAMYFGKEYGTIKEKAAALAKDADYRNDVLGKAPEIADQMAWCYMWEACKNKVEAETNLKRGSDEFMKKAADVFSEAVRMTQVYDSRLTRSQMMRSPDFGAKMITTFMAEPTTSFNMLAYAVLGRVRGDKDALKAIGYVAASILLNSILVSTVYAMRDDDEDKTYGEKYVKSLIPNIIDNANPLNMLPITRDVVSLFQGYDVERADMSLVSDVIKAFKGLSSSTKTPYRKIEDFAGSVANIFGIPAKNVLRDVRGMINTAASVGDVEKTGLGTKYAILSGFGKDVSKGQQMYDALMKGDVKHYERVAAQYATESAARTQLRLAMRASDERISLAAEAKLAGNTETSVQIQNRIISEGHFEQDDVIAAINAEYNLIKKEEQNNEAR